MNRLLFVLWTILTLKGIAAVLQPPYGAYLEREVPAAQVWMVDAQRILTLSETTDQHTPHFFLRLLPALKVIREWTLPGQLLATLPLKAGRFGILLYDAHNRQLQYRIVNAEGGVKKQIELADGVTLPPQPVARAAQVQNVLYAIIGQTLYIGDLSADTVVQHPLPEGSVMDFVVAQDTLWMLHRLPNLSYLTQWVDGMLVRRVQLAVGEPKLLRKVADGLLVVHQFPYYAVLTMLHPATLQPLTASVIPFRECEYTVVVEDGVPTVVAVAPHGERAELRIGSMDHQRLHWQGYEVEYPARDPFLIAAHQGTILLGTATALMGVDLQGRLLFELPMTLLKRYCSQMEALLVADAFVLIKDPEQGVRVIRLEARPLWERIAIEQYWEYLLGAVVAAMVLLVFVRLFQYRRLMRTLFVLPMADAFWVFDNRLRLVRSNHVGQELLGGETAIGQSIGALMQQVPALKELFEAVQKVQQEQVRANFKVDLRSSTAQGIREWLFHIIPLRGMLGRSRGILVIGRDITEVMRHQRLINWAQLVHDMQTNLSIIRLNADQLSRRIKSEEAFFVKKISAQVRILQGRVRDIMLLAAPAQQKPEEIQLEELFAQIRDDLIAISHPEARIVVKADRCDMVGYPRMLERGIRNAGENAIKALEHRPGTILLRCRCQWDMVEIVVQDDGKGMDEAALKKFLTPFETGFHQGTGLGTTIIMRAVLEHRGILKIETAPGHGTRLTFYLPRKPELRASFQRSMGNGVSSNGQIRFNGSQYVVVIGAETAFAGH